jgi:hypothetical protein
VALSLEDVSAETETSIEEDDKFAELSRSELEEFGAILSLLDVTSAGSVTLSLLLAGGSSAGPELLESEEHAKKATLAAVTITRGAANFLSIL